MCEAQNMTRAAVLQGHGPHCLWSLAVKMCAYAYNRTFQMVKRDGKTPFELRYLRPFTKEDYIVPFGAQATQRLRQIDDDEGKKTRFQPRNISVVIIGFTDNFGYLTLDLDSFVKDKTI